MIYKREQYDFNPYHFLRSGLAAMRSVLKYRMKQDNMRPEDTVITMYKHPFTGHVIVDAWCVPPHIEGMMLTETTEEYLARKGFRLQ